MGLSPGFTVISHSISYISFRIRMEARMISWQKRTYWLMISPFFPMQKIYWSS